jgi:hypothetical protein
MGIASGRYFDTTARRGGFMPETSPAPSPSDPVSLIEILAGYGARGYEGQMAARDDGRVMCLTCHQESSASDMRLAGLNRTEGASDPDDMLAVAALECPRCGARGTVVLGYGPGAPVSDSDVLALLDANPRVTDRGPAAGFPRPSGG